MLFSLNFVKIVGFVLHSILQYASVGQMLVRHLILHFILDVDVIRQCAQETNAPAYRVMDHLTMKMDAFKSSID